MILSHRFFEKPIIFEEDCINVLVVENKTLLSKFIMGLSEQKSEGTGDFVLSSDSKEISFSQVELIINPFDLDLNSKTILNHVYSEINTVLSDENHYLDTNALLSNIYSYFDGVLQDFNINMFIEECSVSNLIKVLAPKFTPSGITLLDKICDYLELIQKYLKNQLVIFVNLKLFLNEDEMETFYNFIFYNKINVLLIEQHIFESKFMEKITIIDSDLCELHSF